MGLRQNLLVEFVYEVLHATLIHIGEDLIWSYQSIHRVWCELQGKQSIEKNDDEFNREWPPGLRDGPGRGLGQGACTCPSAAGDALLCRHAPIPKLKEKGKKDGRRLACVSEGLEW